MVFGLIWLSQFSGIISLETNWSVYSHVTQLEADNKLK